MSTRVQFRRGNTAQTAAFTGAVAEVTINTDNNTLVVHDGSTSGGWQTPTLAFAQAAFDKANADAVNFSSGYSANSVLFANSSGYLSNTSGLQFFSSNNSLSVANNINLLGSISSGSLSYAATGVFASFGSNFNGYQQVLLQNQSTGTQASADFVVSNNNSTDGNIYGDFGINGPAFSGTGSLGAPSYVYLYSQATDLAIGTATSNPIHFVVNGSNTDSMYIAANGTVYVNGVDVLNYIGTSFNQANTANTKAQAGFDFANTVNTYAYSAYSTANSAQANTIVIQGVDTTQNTWISSNAALIQSAYSFANTVNTYAYSAYSTANSAQANTVITQGVDATQNTWIAANQVYSQSAYAQANTANTKAQSGYDFANTVNVYAYSAYSTANSAQSNTINIQGVDSTQNAWIAANQVYSQSAFAQANLANIKAQSGYDFANTVNVYVYSAYSTANSAQANTINIQGVDATQNAWIAANQVYSQAAFAFANTVNAYAYSAYAFANTVNAYAYNANTYLQSAISTANSFLKSYSDTTFFTKSGGTISGAVTIQNDLTVTGNITFTGNATSQVISGNTGQFFGYAANGFNALYAGIPTGYLIEPQMITQFTSNYNGYAGVNHQNINSGANSSSDIFITPDNGTTNDGFLDIGMGSSNYNYPGYGVIKPNDGYFLVYGNTTTGGGNLILMTGLTNDIVFAANGTSDSNVVMRISGSGNNVIIKSTVNAVSNTTGALVISGGLGVAGNVYAGNLYSSGTNIVSYIGSAYNQANTANTKAQSGYDFANTVNTYAYSAYSTANSAQANTIILQGVDATQNAWIAANQVYSQAAFAFANTVNTYAYSAYAQANSEPIGTAAFVKANGAVQTGFTTIAANGTNISPSTNTDTLTITSAVANGINILNPSSKTIDFGLRNSGVTAGTYGNTTSIPTVTVDSFGRVTAISNNSITVPAGTSIYGNTGQITANVATGIVALGLATTGVSSGTYGGSTQIPVLTVDTYGRVTSAANTSVSTTISLTGTTGSGSVSGGGTLTFSSSNGFVASVSGSTVTLSDPQDIRTTASPSFANLTATSTTASISNTTGAIVVSGGLGVAGNVYSNAIYTNGLFYAANGQPISTGGGGSGATISSVAAATTYYIGLSASSSGSWTDARVDTTNLFYTSSNNTLYVTNYNTSSDANLKDNIITIPNPVDTINKLRGVSFTWKKTGEKSYGVIAQELQEILPELVSDAGGHKSVNYNALIGFLIETVKELSDRVTELEKK